MLVRSQCWRRASWLRPQSGWEDNLREEEAKSISGSIRSRAHGEPESSRFPRVFRRASPKRCERSTLENVTRRRFGFVTFVDETMRLIRRKTSPLMNFLRQHYADPVFQHLPFVSSTDGRPFPSVPPFAHAAMSAPASGRRRSRFFFKRAIMRLANLYAGCLSWLALGSPEWASSNVTCGGLGLEPEIEKGWDAGCCPLSSLPWDPRTGPATREAVRTYVREVARMACDSGVFTGLSGGREQIAASLLEPMGSGRDQVRSETLKSALGENVTGASERPGAGILPFRSGRLAVPAQGADFPLLAWAPDAWREALEDPDRGLPDRAPVDEYTRM
jgi:hypothetical protein